MRIVFILISTMVTLALAACYGGSGDTFTLRSPDTASASVPVVAPATVPTTPSATTVTGSRIVVTDASGDVGQVVSVSVVISDAKNGISGYSITVAVADPSIVRITNAKLPDFGLIQVSELPASSVDIMAVDLPGLLEGDIKAAELATLSIELLEAGTTDVFLEIHSLDDDDGNVVMPQLVSGKITVN